MAKPNYGYIKRQKQLKKQKKKELKARKRQEEGGAEFEGQDSLAEALEEVKRHMASMDPESELYPLGENILQNQEVFPQEILFDMAQDFLERAEDLEDEDDDSEDDEDE